MTGASSGIGEAIARALAREGFLVYAAARRVERMRDLEALGVRVLRMDLTDDTSITGAIARVQHEAGRVDVLVNNAGYGAYGALEDVPLEHARRQVEVNLFGLARSIQLVLPMMREQRAGRIINISSIGGKIHEPMGGWYHATKFAVEGLSDCLRMELAPFGIHVVVVLPGAVKSEWSRIARESLLARSADGPYAEQAALVGSLMQRADEGSAASPEAVAKAVVKAATKRRPKTRYAMGGGAKPLLALRWLLSDRAFDGLMRFAMRFASRASRGASRAG